MNMNPANFFDVLRDYETRGLISSRKHPTIDLWIWNYTDRTTFNKLWDPVTMACRSLVTDGDGNVVARAFRKFFNDDESSVKIPSGPRRVFKKYDGSLILVFWYADRFVVCSRASFASVHVEWATQILQDRLSELTDRSVTYVFELIHPENRIVVSYGGVRDLVFLAAFYHDGEEAVGFPCPKNFVAAEELITDADIAELKTKDPPNEEGYVLVWTDGTRVKVKFPSYKVLHRSQAKVTLKDVGLLYAADPTLEPDASRVASVPDEFHDEFRKAWRRYAELDAEIHREYIDSYCPDKVEFARKNQEHRFKNAMILMHLGREHRHKLYDLLKRKQA